MRTTLSVDEDEPAVAKAMAQRRQMSVGEVICELARQALQPAKARLEFRSGVPLLRDELP